MVTITDPYPQGLFTRQTTLISSAVPGTGRHSNRAVPNSTGRSTQMFSSQYQSTIAARPVYQSKEYLDDAEGGIVRA